jgi:hypothetical protein
MTTDLIPMGGGDSSVVNNINNYFTEVAQESTGFVDPAASTLAFNDTTREFTITPVSTSFVFYAFGVRYEKTEEEGVTIDDVTGQWYIYYDSDGVLGCTQTIWNLSTQVPVGSIYWNGATGVIDTEEPPAKPPKTSNLYVISVSSPGSLTDDQLILFHVVVGGESIELAKKLFYSYIKCGTAPTAQADFDIQVNGVSKGTATIASGQTTGYFTWNSKVALSGGDTVKIFGPSTADSTLEDVSITIKGARS